MLFRNLRLYKLSSDRPESEQDLSDALANGEFSPCGSLSERSLGWEAPATELPDMFARRVAGADLMRLRHQVRVLPAAAVKEALEDRLKECEARMGQPANARDIYLLILAKDSCRETSGQQLIELELAMGNRAAARRHCLRLRAALDEELGIEIQKGLNLVACEL